MLKKILFLIALVGLALAYWWIVGRLLGMSYGAQIPLTGIGVLGFLALLWAARRLGIWFRLAAGLLILAASFLPIFLSMPYVPDRFPSLIDTFLAVWPMLVPSLAIVAAALLLYAGIRRVRGRGLVGGSESGEQPAGWITAACFILGTLLLVKMLNWLYWLMLWDNTDDPLGFIWLFLPVAAALSSGILLSILLPGRYKLAGVYGLLLPVLMVAVTAPAQGIDFRLETEERAVQASQAIESYYARNGRYPQDLRQLTPWYGPSLPGPFIIYGEEWCYDGGAGYYRLGYVDREHWSSPVVTGRVFKAVGSLPDLPGICAAEIAALHQRDPSRYNE